MPKNSKIILLFRANIKINAILRVLAYFEIWQSTITVIRPTLVCIFLMGLNSLEWG